MSAVIDLHVHTALCGHASGMPAEYVRAAAERGVRVMAFTDHMPLAPALARRVPGAERYAMCARDLERYLDEVRAARDLGESLGVEVLLGIEVDLVPDAIEYARSIVADTRFDMVLGSVHFIDDWAFDDPAHVSRYDDWDLHELWERYFEELVQAASAGVADVIAHADLVKKFCGAASAPTGGLFRSVARDLARCGVAVEVNTAGLRKPCAEVYPGPALLAAFRAAGVPATLGSDAHAPDEVGMDHAAGISALKEAGYRSVVVFRGRVAEEVVLDDA